MARARIVVLTLVVLAFCGVLFGQSQQGRIVGRVTDASGAVIPNAKVVITEIATGLSRTLQTNAAGDYFAPNLNPGVYSVTVEAPSFGKVARSGIRLEVATNLQLDFSLKPGSVSESVQVTGEQPMVDTVSDTLGGTLTNKAINELPLQGRDFQNLLMLRPGVQRTPGGGMLSITSNGLRTTQNNFMVDGADSNDIYYGDTVVNGAGVMGTPASHLPLDAIQEFNDQQNQGSEFGWKPGAVVNIGLRSGTNDLHGTAYYFNRNSAYDARNYFSPPPNPVPALNLHEFGASLGGHIIKDKWFYFGNYEGVRDKVGNPWPVSSPITTPFGDSSLSIPDAIANCTPNCNPLSLKIAQMFLANPGNTVSTNDPSLINFNFNNTNREDNFVFKSDYHLNSKSTFTGRWVYGNSHQIEEDTSPLLPQFMSYADTRVNVISGDWTFIPNSRWVNTAKFSVNRMWQQIDSVDHLLGDPSTVYGINTGITDPKLFGFPRISISPFSYLGGNSSWPLATTPNSTFQFSDNISWVRGAHSIQFGGEFRDGISDNYRAQYGKGRIDFRSLNNFMAGNVRRGYLLTGDTTRNLSMKAFGGYFKDDWRVSKRLTVNLGLRYDYTQPIEDSRNLLANFIPSGPVTGLVQVGQGIDSPYNASKTDFSPHVGLAWDIMGDGKTVFRAGTGIIYEQPTMRTFVDKSGLQLNPSGAQGVTPGNGTISVMSRTLSASQINWSLAGPIFSTTGLEAMTCSADTPCDVVGVDPNLKSPRVLSWNANLQRQLTKSMALQVAYVANRGINLYSHRDINQVNPLDPVEIANDHPEQPGRPFTANCPVSDGGEGLGGPCFPWVGYAFYIQNLASSNYQSLQVTLTQKTWKGLDFLAGYTWAHAIDNSTSDRSGYPQDAWNFNGERGNGDYDIRNRFTLSLTYTMPTFKAPLQMGKGWQFTSIIMLEGGMPYNFYDAQNDISHTYTWGYERWDFWGDPSSIKLSPINTVPYYDGVDNPFPTICTEHARSLETLNSYGCYATATAAIIPQPYDTFGNMGRNIFRGPGFQNWDLSFSKVFNVNERMRVQLRGEFFNVLNHPNFALGSANTDLGSYPVGQLTATPDVYAANPVVGSGGSRHIQLGLKLIW
jgi:hypothetical protein